MKNCLKAMLFLLVGLLISCTTLDYPPPQMGISEQALVAQSGPPSAKYQDGNDLLLEYAGYWSQHAYMARFSPNGRLTSWEQVRTSAKFATVKVGETTKRQILLTFGQPTETSYFPRLQLEAWSYRFKEEGVWNAMMHIHFDAAGVVRLMFVGPDPSYDDVRRK